MFRAFDVDMRVGVDPFIEWEQGDLRPFLKFVPWMVAYVASSHKPKVPRIFLMILERTNLYVEDHSSLVHLMALNCGGIDEEDVEKLNAMIGRLLRARIKDLNISHDQDVTGTMGGMHAIDALFDALLERDPDSLRENERLLRQYSKGSWAATHSKFDAWLLQRFRDILRGDDERFSDDKWPRADYFKAGWKRVIDVYLPELRKWAKKQEKEGAAAEAAAAAGAAAAAPAALPLPLPQFPLLLTHSAIKFIYSSRGNR